MSELKMKLCVQVNEIMLNAMKQIWLCISISLIFIEGDKICDSVNNYCCIYLNLIAT